MLNKMFAQSHIALFVLLLSLFAVFATRPASAQVLPTGINSKEEKTNALDALLEEARKDGSTIIVVRPRGANTATANEDENANRSARFFKARARTAEIFASVPTLWPNIQETLRIASPDGSFFWLFRAIVTALLGLFAG